MPESSWPHVLQPTRLLRPWDFPGKSTAVGCHGLLQKERLGSCYSPSPPYVPVVIVFKLLDKNAFFWDRKLALWKIFTFLFFESCLRQCWPEKLGLSSSCPFSINGRPFYVVFRLQEGPRGNEVNPLFVLTTLGDRPGAALWLGSHQRIPVALAFLLDCRFLGNDANSVSSCIILNNCVEKLPFLFDPLTAPNTEIPLADMTVFPTLWNWVYFMLSR